MIGDAYFQLRAQIGTALFSVLRLAMETGASETVLAALRAEQDSLRESFLFLALGPSGSGKSALLNALFEREFCGADEVASASRGAVFQYGEEAQTELLPTGVFECRRPHSFLRDFTVVDPPGIETLDDPAAADFAPYLARADVIFLVISAREGVVNAWDFLARLSREALKRTVFVVWQCDRVSPDEAAQVVKSVRQAMLKNLSQACPIFAASNGDSAGLEKLRRWMESEVIFSTPRRTHLGDLDRLAEEALREVAAPPRAAEAAWRRAEERLRRLRDLLAEYEEQSGRQIAGALWAAAQSFDAVRLRGEALLREQFLLIDLVRDRSDWRIRVAREMEAQAGESLGVQMADALDGLEAELRAAHADHRQDCHETFGEELPGTPPPFPRSEIAAAAAISEVPLGLERVLAASAARAKMVLRLPVFAALGAIAVTLGAWPLLGWVTGTVWLAGGAAFFTLLLAWLLREQVVATLGAHFTANRAAWLIALDAPLRRASQEFYAAVVRPLDARISVHNTARHRHEPPLARIAQLEETFARIAAALQASAASARLPEETSATAE